MSTTSELGKENGPKRGGNVRRGQHSDALSFLICALLLLLVRDFGDQQDVLVLCTAITGLIRIIRLLIDLGDNL